MISIITAKTPITRLKILMALRTNELRSMPEEQPEPVAAPTPLHTASWGVSAKTAAGEINAKPPKITVAAQSRARIERLSIYLVYIIYDKYNDRSSCKDNEQAHHYIDDHLFSIADFATVAIGGDKHYGRNHDAYNSSNRGHNRYQRCRP
jgi:hypothetical protein